MTDNPRTISVTGSGSAEAAPDLLTISIGVECRREKVAAAYGDAGRAAAAVTAALRDHGVGSPDITTSGLNVRAEVNWQEGHGKVFPATWPPVRSASGSGSSQAPPTSSLPRLLPAATTSGSTDCSWASPIPPPSWHGPVRQPGTMPSPRRSTTPPSPAPGSARQSPSPSSPGSSRRSRSSESSSAP